jgi:uncharacterized membrane protein YjjP (DUF1212 family)
MSMMKKLDQIPPPYSTMLALVICTAFGAYFMVSRGGDRSLLGIGIIAGGILAIVCKKAAEVSDRAVFRKLTGRAQETEGSEPNK